MSPEAQLNLCSSCDVANGVETKVPHKMGRTIPCHFKTNQDEHLDICHYHKDEN